MIALGAWYRSIRRAAKNVSTTALMLISPSPIVIGTISTKTSATAGSRQSITSCSRPSRPRSQGIGSSIWMIVAIRIETA